MQLTAFQSSGGLSGQKHATTLPTNPTNDVGWQRIRFQVQDITDFPPLLPLHLPQPGTDGSPPRPLDPDEGRLADVILKEEQQLYDKYLVNVRQKRGLVAVLRTTAVFQDVLLALLETVLTPSRAAAAARARQARIQQQQVRGEIERLKRDVAQSKLELVRREEWARRKMRQRQSEEEDDLARWAAVERVAEGGPGNNARETTSHRDDSRFLHPTSDRYVSTHPPCHQYTAHPFASHSGNQSSNLWSEAEHFQQADAQCLRHQAPPPGPFPEPPHPFMSYEHPGNVTYHHP